LLPYLPPPAPLLFFGLRIPVFGLLLVASTLTAYLLVVRRGRALGEAAPAAVERFAQLVTVTAILGAHLSGALADHGRAALLHPSLLLSTTATFSSAGGFACGILAGSLYLRWTGLAARPFADLAAHAFPFAWLLARAGCALVHDHPGRLSVSLMAVRFPGGSRFDCGLLECLATLPLIALVLTIARRPRPPGLLAGVVAVAYSLVRFPLDFLRATDLPGSDARYSGLTAAQWGCAALAGAGAYWTFTVAKKARSPAPSP
jgi:phosphatidylglycerol:prolipoprotein diacylglycerol transferase